MKIKGHFDDGKPLIKIIFEGDEKSTEVLVDTGFNGDLMLQDKEIRRLGLKKAGTDSYTTASGNNVLTSVYLGHIKWFGRDRRVAVLATRGRHALIGMQLLHFYRLDMEPSKGKLIICDTEN